MEDHTPPASSQQAGKANLSFPLLLIDLVGTACIALGFAEMTEVLHVVPETLQINNYPVWLIVLGFLLMVPFTLDFFKQTRQR